MTKGINDAEARRFSTASSGLKCGQEDSEPSLQPVVLVGLENIAKAVGAGRLAVRRWIQEERFPARRCTDGIYRADPAAVRRWFATTLLEQIPPEGGPRSQRGCNVESRN